VTAVHYAIKPGDTLWDIARRELGDPLAWAAIWQLNPCIENPDLIYAGQALLLPTKGGAGAVTIDAPDPKSG
jgi:nucleoid-associated protein YgaU